MLRNGLPNRASSAARMMSQAKAMPNPPPTHGPSTTEIVGTGMARNTGE